MASAIGALIISLLLAQMQLEKLAATQVHTVQIVMPDAAMFALATSTAAKYHLNVEHFVKVINCESGASSTIQSTVPDIAGPNGRENSWGIAQINLDPKNHPEVTMEQALDPTWSLEWMAERWVDGHAHEWTCWRNYYELIPTPPVIAHI